MPVIYSVVLIWLMPFGSFLVMLSRLVLPPLWLLLHVVCVAHITGNVGGGVHRWHPHRTLPSPVLDKLLVRDLSRSLSQ